ITCGVTLSATEGPARNVGIRGPAATLRRHRLLPLLREYLCPSLQGASSDAFEIARVVTTLLVGLKVSGKVPLDLNPWLFAGVALLVERMGVTAFCAEHSTGGDTEKHPPPSEKRRRPKSARRRPEM